MIPDLPAEMTDRARLAFYDTLLGNLSDQSTIHMNWFTHRRDPSVCWICDYFNLSQKVMDIATKNITKSTVDIETSLRAELDSDSESEISDDDEESQMLTDLDEENVNVPEYDTEEYEH